MKTVQQDVDERSALAGNNKFELLLFRLGGDAHGERNELFGINVFKIREIVPMPQLTALAGALPQVLGVVDLRGQVVEVFDLPAIAGCTPAAGLNIMLVTEFARTTQAFAVESVEEIVRLDWSAVLSAEAGAAAGSAMVTSIARVGDEGGFDAVRLVQVLDLETILRSMAPPERRGQDRAGMGPPIALPAGAVILAADDSLVARTLIEQSLVAMGVPFIMTRSGKEAWERLQGMASAAEAEGKAIGDKVALVLTDLEMPEMDGFTLTRNIKKSARFSSLPVVIHSSLSGTTNEEHVRRVGADAFVAKFAPDELAATIRAVLQ